MATKGVIIGGRIVSQEVMNRAKRLMWDAWRNDWNLFVRQALGANLDHEQQDILRSVQYNPRTAVASGTARGKDFVAACAALCFLILTPRWDRNGQLVENTKVALTAPTGRQVDNIMMPEISRLFNKAKKNGIIMPSMRLIANGIKTGWNEWFLTGFKADDNNQEVWSGFHAVNTMFVVTEASGLAETIYNAIEGNLQGNSRLFIVFNPNVTTGYAANAMKSARFARFRLDSLNAENVIKKKNIIPGQVNYEWVVDKVKTWCAPINKKDFDEGRGDFEFEGKLYRPNDLFRVKVRGMFPEVAEDVLVPYSWIERANENWKTLREKGFKSRKKVRLGVDVAGMGRDSSVLVPRYGNWVPEFKVHQSGGKADHMAVAGMVRLYLYDDKARAFIDTIGEGAGVYSRLVELDCTNAISCKFSESAKGLSDLTGQYTFANMRAYLYWKVREWLNPKNGFLPALPFDEELMQELTATKWSFRSDGSIVIEKKELIKERLKRSPDKMDALANTFYPFDSAMADDKKILQDFL